MKGMSRFENAHGANITMIEQDCQRLVNTHSYLGSHEWKVGINGVDSTLITKSF